MALSNLSSMYQQNILQKPISSQIPFLSSQNQFSQMHSQAITQSIGRQAMTQNASTNNIRVTTLMRGLSPEEESQQLQFMSQSQNMPQNSKIEASIYAENKESLDEYVLKIPELELSSYLYLKKQIDKQKYSIQISPDQNTLTLGLKVFDPFTLKRIEKDSSEMLKDYYRECYKVNTDLKKQICLFNYFFLHCWSEKRRENLPLVLGSNMHRDIINSLESLFHCFKVWANIDAQTGEKALISPVEWSSYCAEDVTEALLWQNGLMLIDDKNNIREKKGDEETEEAKGRVVKIQRQWTFELPEQGKYRTETYYGYATSAQVEDDKEYMVYIPKRI